MQLVNVDALVACTVLKSLDLSNCSQIMDVAALASCGALEKLTLLGCSVADVSPLAKCANLQMLDLRASGALVTAADTTALSHVDVVI